MLRLSLHDDEDLMKQFDNYTLNHTPKSLKHGSLLSPRTASKKPHPLTKQKSLPMHLVTSQSYQQESTFTSTRFGNASPRQYGWGNDIQQSQGLDDESQEEWFEHFGGIEMESSTVTSNFENSIYQSFQTDDFLIFPEQQSTQTTNFDYKSIVSKGKITSPPQLSSSSPSTHLFPPRSDIQGSPYRQATTNGNQNRMSPTSFNAKHSSRIINVQNGDTFPIDQLIACFQTFGDIRSTSKLSSSILISYYDLRHAQAAMQSLNGKKASSNTEVMDLSFYFLKEFYSVEESNQGTLVIFNLDINVANDDLLAIFGEYGHIREIRESPNKKHKFVEFFDVREAEKAMKCLNKTEIGGRKIKIEASRPGGNKTEFNKERREILTTHFSSSAPNQSALANRFHNNPDDDGSLSPNMSRKIKITNKPRSSSTYKSNTSFESPTYSSRAQDIEKKVDIPEDRGFYGSPTQSRDPKFDLDLDRIQSRDDDRTTLMIKNIPNKYDQEMLLSAVNKYHNGLYDFFYLPIDFKNKCNVGYAFINFIDPISIPEFYKEFNNKKWEKFNSEKVCQIAYARIQGKESMVEHFKNSSLLFEDPKCRPLIFQSDGQGRPEPFPIGPNVRPRSKKESNGGGSTTPRQFKASKKETK